MRIVKKLILLSFLAMPFFGAYSQNIIQGQIIDNDSKEPIPGVEIVLKETTEGVTSDGDGFFEFSTESQIDSIIVSFTGYKSQTVRAESNLLVELKTIEFELGQVVVSASREIQAREDAPVAIATLTPKVLDEAKATSIDQVLNKVSGVLMVDFGNEQHGMSIRQPIGLKSTFLYLEDGIPIRTIGVFNHNALLEINMANVRRIEVIRGPASSLYGSEAIGGAINFITQRPSVLPTANAQIQGNNLGYKRADFAASNTWKTPVIP